INSDDFYADSSVIADIVEAMQEQSVEAIYADLQYVNEKNTSRITRTWRSGKYTLRGFRWGWMPPHPTFFVARRLYEDFGTFNTNLKSAADYELMLRLLYKHKVKAYYLPRVTVKMRLGGVSNSSLANRIRANKEDRKAWTINGLNAHFFTTYLKPLRKVTQFIF
ncbi:MAG: glycosyltransferase, partial [Bacteroidota bacterium]